MVKIRYDIPLKVRKVTEMVNITVEVVNIPEHQIFYNFTPQDFGVQSQYGH